MDANVKNSVEAVLFMSTEPISVERIAHFTNLDKDQVTDALNELMKEYEERKCAIVITKSDEKYIMQVRDEYLDIVSRITKNTELSKGEMKTLAYIAKKEGNTGVIQSQLIKALGESTYAHVHTLIEKGFINAKRKGRSKLLNTTSKFREYFKIANI